MAVSASWLDPITNFDLSTSTVVTESIWDNVMSDIEYIGAAVEPDTLVNRAGGTLTAGTVVIADVSTDKSFTTTAVASDVRVIGIVMDTVANGASGRIGAAGVIDVKMHTPVTRGNFIGAGSAASYAKDIGASKIEGSFGISLSTILNGASASVPVLVRTSLGGGGGASLVASNIQLSNGSLVFTENAAGSNVVALRPPSAILNDVTWTMPDHVGTSGQVLGTLGGGAGANTLYWATTNIPAAAKGASINEQRVNYGSTGGNNLPTTNSTSFITVTGEAGGGNKTDLAIAVSKVNSNDQILLFVDIHTIAFSLTGSADFIEFQVQETAPDGASTTYTGSQAVVYGLPSPSRTDFHKTAFIGGTSPTGSYRYSLQWKVFDSSVTVTMGSVVAGTITSPPQSIGYIRLPPG